MGVVVVVVAAAVAAAVVDLAKHLPNLLPADCRKRGWTSSMLRPGRLWPGLAGIGCHLLKREDSGGYAVAPVASVAAAVVAAAAVAVAGHS